MDGFSLMHYSENWGVAYLAGDIWRCSVYPTEKAEATMAEIEAAIGHRSQQLEGFTLFAHPGKGWQMSVRRHGETGWDVKIIPDEQAQVILSMLHASGHPDGPMQVRMPFDALLPAAEAAVRGLTAAIRQWGAG